MKLYTPIIIQTTSLRLAIPDSDLPGVEERSNLSSGSAPASRLGSFGSFCHKTAHPFCLTKRDDKEVKLSADSGGSRFNDHGLRR